MSQINSTYANFDTAALAFNRKSAPMDKAPKNPDEARETAENFEAFFMTKMMESMFEGISTEGMFGGGHAEKIYRSMLLDEYGKVMAKTGTVGVSDSIMVSIIQMQEAQSSAAL